MKPAKTLSLCLAWLAVLPTLAAGDGQPAPASTDASVLAAFKVFAEGEAAKYKTNFGPLVGQFIVEPQGQHIVFSKYAFSGVKLEAAPAEYDFDVKKSDSILSPYTAYIRFPIVLIKATVYIKGDADYCNAQPISKCLANGGEYYESNMMYKPRAERVPDDVHFEYVYQDGRWAPKSDFKKTLEQAVLALNLARPLPRSQVPSLFGIPRPQPTPPDSGDTAAPTPP